jgi:hypothetical protein
MKKWTDIVLEQTGFDVDKMNEKLKKLGSYDKYPISEVEKIIKSFSDNLWLDKSPIEGSEVDDGGEGDSDLDFTIMQSVEDGPDKDTGKSVNLKVDHKGDKFVVTSAKVS